MNNEEIENEIKELNKRVLEIAENIGKISEVLKILAGKIIALERKVK